MSTFQIYRVIGCSTASSMTFMSTAEVNFFPYVAFPVIPIPYFYFTLPEPLLLVYSNEATR